MNKIKLFIVLLSMSVVLTSFTKHNTFLFSNLTENEKSIFIEKRITTGDCSFKGKKLFGKVQFVTSFPDVKIQYVDTYADINVQMVSTSAKSCGQWQEVKSAPDLKVQVVNSFPDLKVKLVKSSPGMK